VSARQALNHLDEILASIARKATKFEQFVHLFDQGTSLGCAADSDRASATYLKQAFIAQYSQRPQNGIDVDAEYGSKVFCLWNPHAWARLTFRDRSANLRSDLIVKIGRLGPIHLCEGELAANRIWAGRFVVGGALDHKLNNTHNSFYGVN
jgi:hypothetical protein